MVTNVPLFIGNVDEWSDLQRKFVTWCIFYYNIARMDEPPPQHIVNDDIELDAFLRTREAKIRQDRIKMAAESKRRNTGVTQREIFK